MNKAAMSDRLAGAINLPAIVIRKYHPGLAKRRDFDDLESDGRLQLVRLDRRVPSSLQGQQFNVYVIRWLRLYYRNVWRRLNGVYTTKEGKSVKKITPLTLTLKHAGEVPSKASLDVLLWIELESMKGR